MPNGITNGQHWETLPTNREKVLMWLQSINADEKEIAEVVKLCEDNKYAREYFVSRSEEDICR